MSTASQAPAQLKTYFWMVHYDTTPTPETAAAGELKPIAAGRKRMIMVVHRNLYGDQLIGVNTARDGENGADPGTFRGAPVLRNRIIGFYNSPEEANAHLGEKLWAELQQKAGAVYAELHSIKLDVAKSKEELLKLVA